MIDDCRLGMDNPFLKRFWLLAQVSHPKKQKSLWFRKPKEIFKGKIFLWSIFVRRQNKT
jgi:hypothetical protein